MSITSAIQAAEAEAQLEAFRAAMREQAAADTAEAMPAMIALAERMEDAGLASAIEAAKVEAFSLATEDAAQMVNQLATLGRVRTRMSQVIREEIAKRESARFTALMTAEEAPSA